MVHMASVTEVRKNIRALLEEVVRTKEPAVILQRSRPVAYLIDAETFEKMRRSEATAVLTRSRRDSLERILRLKGRAAGETEVRVDSTTLIRELREGSNRDE